MWTHRGGWLVKIVLGLGRKLLKTRLVSHSYKWTEKKKKNSPALHSLFINPSCINMLLFPVTTRKTVCFSPNMLPSLHPHQRYLAESIRMYSCQLNYENIHFFVVVVSSSAKGSQGILVGQGEVLFLQLLCLSSSVPQAGSPFQGTERITSVFQPTTTQHSGHCFWR